MFAPPVVLEKLKRTYVQIELRFTYCIRFLCNFISQSLYAVVISCIMNLIYCFDLSGLFSAVGDRQEARGF